MTYSPFIRRPVIAAQPALSGVDGAMKPVFVVLGIGAVVGLGYLIYAGSKRERAVRKQILDKEGSTGLARYEDAKTKRAAVEGGLGILSGLAWGGGNGFGYHRGLRRNKKKSRRSSRRLRSNHGMTFGQWYEAAGRPDVSGPQIEYAIMRLRDDWEAGVDPFKYRSLTRNKRRRTSRRRRAPRR
jgi:hypothetical protein